jgi:hypothetical protein
MPLLTITGGVPAEGAAGIAGAADCCGELRSCFFRPDTAVQYWRPASCNCTTYANIDASCCTLATSPVVNPSDVAYCPIRELNVFSHTTRSASLTGKYELLMLVLDLVNARPVP